MSDPTGMPTEFVQLVALGGWIFDLSPEQASMVRVEMDANPASVTFEDIYGAECVVRCAHIVGFRHQTAESAATYKAMHVGEDDAEGWG